eukprot:CAMPEP_0185754320 /NCGR_PEP_ID=MMETSP1174-20130828/12953_1 /TAXON_ID=35687 /ORGANISM="Dictyocha speculum, Strain CCMP1381" /LENGTH=896 /DNA_ID=CAMNT_0028432469 /DNA_START=46 /DNA_END=2736 /DNA_ORIENTATION=+
MAFVVVRSFNPHLGSHVSSRWIGRRSRNHVFALGTPPSSGGVARWRPPQASVAAEDVTSAAAQYDHAAVESRWQDYWEENQTFRAVRRPGKEKKYVLDMFPYPSGSGLHVGHPEGYTASDIMARYWRMCDFDVLHPMGWDSFGLPAEQYAIQTGTPPASTTKANIATFKRQLKSLGFSFDWAREMATTDDDYVRWTQWIFIQLYKQNLAAQSEVLVNWCPALGTVLANEEIINGLSERGDHPVERIPLRQWVLKITMFAEELVDGLEGLDWPEGTMAAQKAWIGKSEGAQIEFEVAGQSGTEVVKAFTTRPDTLMGVTYVVLAPEHPLVDTICTEAQVESVKEYVSASARKSDMDRTATGADRGKSGVSTGAFALHPLTGAEVPIWVADYVLGSYGTGAVMAVPAHDTRDFEFASLFGLPMKTVVVKADVVANQSEDDGTAMMDEAFCGEGVTVNSGEGLDGLTTSECKDAIVGLLEAEGKGTKQVTYKLRDWVFSRQRYWGEPIPIYFPVEMGEGGGDPRLGDDHKIRFDEPIAVAEEDLPLKLPHMDNYEPGTDPQGCLARATDWRYFEKDGAWFARETNTMPQWAGSCWYFLRYIDPDNQDAAWSLEADKSWMPVDLYVGGQEHAVLHLLYARFWHKVLHQLGLTAAPEPFQKLVHQGMILGADGEKMSKSRGNVVNPDDVVKEYGADALRLYEMFMGPLEATKPWQTSQVTGVVRFRNKVFNLASMRYDLSDESMDDETARILHKTMKKVTEDVENLAFNTAISALMVLVNHLSGLKTRAPPREAVEKVVLMISPFAPHVAEECWQILGHEGSIARESWVTWDEKLCIDSVVKLGVQVNGKVRGTIELAKDADETEAQELGLALESVQKFVEGKTIKKVIYVPGRILNIVAK